MSEFLYGFLAQIGNLRDPGQRERALDAFKPKGFGPVASSRNFTKIISLLLSGVHYETIAVIVQKDCGEWIPPGSIRAYALEHVPPDLMCAHLQLEFLKRQPVLDEIEVLEILQKLTLQRLMTLTEQGGRPIVGENGKPVVAVGSSDGTPVLPDVDEKIHQTIQLSARLAESTLKAKLAVGRITKAVQKVEVEVKQTTFEDADGVYQVDERGKNLAYHMLREFGVLEDRRVIEIKAREKRKAREAAEEAQKVGSDQAASEGADSTKVEALVVADNVR